MGKGKDEKQGRKKAQAKPIKKEERHRVELEPFDNKFNIDGVIKLVLSTITQRAVGCVVGEDITTEDPWIYIKKEKVTDNLELHEESSEFLPIKQCIIEYPAEDMLIGFDKPIEEDKQEFFFCTKFTAQQEVAIILEKQKAEMQERLKQSVTKHPGKWTSFGSENEVSENIIHNCRPLIEVEVDSKYPLYGEKKKRLRLVEDAIDGYVEILPERLPITNVHRKIVDCAIQAAPPTIENQAQTNPTYPKNMWTQYKYEYEEPKLNADESKHLIKFIRQKTAELDDAIHVNEHINLYTNDYLRLAKEEKGPAGNTVCEKFSNARRKHVKKDTIAIADSVRAVRNCTIPAANKVLNDGVNINRKRSIERREKYQAWLQAWKQRYGQEKSQQAEAHAAGQQQRLAAGDEANAEIKQEETKAGKSDDVKAEAKQEEGSHHKKKKEPVSSEKKWREKQEKIMYDILLEQKKLNLTEIEKHKIPLQKLIEEHQSRQVKVQEILAKKDKIFDDAKNSVLKDTPKIEKRRYKPVLSPETRDKMQKTYIEHYNGILPDTMKYVETHSYTNDFERSKIISQGKERRKSTSAQYISPTNKDRKKAQAVNFTENMNGQNEVHNNE